MTNYIKELLGLQGFKVLEMEIEGKEVEVTIEPELEIGVCPNCGKVSNKRHDYHFSKVRDLSVSGKRVILHLKRIRLYCPNCKRPFLMDVGLCGKKKSYTRRFGEEIYARINYSTIQDVVREEGLGYGQVFRIFRDMRKEKKRLQEKKLPPVLSLDEISVKKRHKYSTVLSAPRERKVLDLIKGKDARRISDALKMYPKEEREEVKAVIIDRFKPYKKVVKEMFRNALIIPDKFHLIAEVNSALDRVRKRIQKEKVEKKGKRESWWKGWMKKEEFSAEEREGKRIWGVLRFEPKLRRAYRLKEGFREALEKRYEDFVKWRFQAMGSIFEEFKKIARSFVSWDEEIRNYYRRKAWTNGFAEGINNKIKVIKRRAYGFRNEENFKERVLAACG